MSEKEFFTCIPMATFDTSGLTGTYASLNGTGFADDIKILKVFNASDVGVTISYDGSTDQDFFPPTSTLIIDLQTNHSAGGSTAAGKKNGRKGQIVSGKGSAGTGNLYIIGYR